MTVAKYAVQYIFSELNHFSSFGQSNLIFEPPVLLLMMMNSQISANPRFQNRRIGSLPLPIPKFNASFCLHSNGPLDKDTLFRKDISCFARCCFLPRRDRWSKYVCVTSSLFYSRSLLHATRCRGWLKITVLFFTLLRSTSKFHVRQMKKICLEWVFCFKHTWF